MRVMATVNIMASCELEIIGQWDIGMLVRKLNSMDIQLLCQHGQQDSGQCHQLRLES